MRKPRIIMNNEENANQEWVDELLGYKKEGKLQEFGEEVAFDKDEKKINCGNIILYDYPNASIYAKVTLAMITENIFTRKKKQIVKWHYEDVIIKNGD